MSEPGKLFGVEGLGGLVGRHLGEYVFGTESFEVTLNEKEAGGRELNLLARPRGSDLYVIQETIVKRGYRPSEDIGPVKTAVDLGANIGDSTLAMLIDHKPEVIVAVELEPRNFELMRENLRRNGFEGQVIALNEAVYSKDGIVKVQMNINAGHHMANEEKGAGRIKAVTLRTLLSEAGMLGRGDDGKQKEIDFFKMDIEGGEDHVLTYENEDIFRNVRYVHMESHGPELGGTDIDAAERYFKKLGFRVKTRPVPYKGGRMVEAFNPAILDREPKS